MVVYEDLGNNMTRAYSDSGYMLSGGSPAGLYAEAIDPTPAGRTYVETDQFVPTREQTSTARTFSKLSLEQALFQTGALSAVDAFIDSQNITNEYGQSVPLRRFYNTALTFREDHPLFSQYLSAIASTLGWTS